MSNAIWVWLDLEMTGLDVKQDKILEVSCILTTPELHGYTNESFSMVVHQNLDVLEAMSDWCIEQHGNSGLTQSCLDSDVSLEMVEGQIIRHIQSHTLPTDSLFLAGNSIHTDRSFIKEHMKGFESMLHYRMIDVTSVAMVCGSMGVSLYKKESPHRALDDIKMSIEELKHYIKQLGGRAIG